MTAALVESYRLAREAQDARFDGYARGAATGTQDTRIPVVRAARREG